MDSQQNGWSFPRAMEGDTRKTTRYTAFACRTFRGSTGPISRAIGRRGAGPTILETQAVLAVVVPAPGHCARVGEEAL